MFRTINVHIQKHRDHLSITDAFGWASALVVFVLPFSIKLTTYAIILLVVIWLLQKPLKEVSNTVETKRHFWLISGLYFLTIVSLIYTEDFKAGLWELEKGVALVLFPLLMASARQLSKKTIEIILKTFLLSNLLFGVISVLYASFKYVAEGINIFFYHDLVSPLFNSHATYYSMYLIFSLFILYYFYFQRDKPSVSMKLFTGAVTIFFSVIIYLLAIRSITFFFTGAALIAIAVYIYKTRHIIFGVGMLAAFILLIFLALKNNDVLKEKVFQIFENYEYELSKDHIEGYNGLTTRLAQWESSLSIIGDHPLFGVAPADVQEKLQEVYLKNYLLYSFRNRFNAHSQYFQTTLGLGLIGLAVFFASLIIPAWIALRSKNLLYLGFLILFSFCCITESMLYVQKGIVFYSFFTSLFLLQMMKLPEERKTKSG